MYVCECIPHACRCPQRTEESIRLLELELQEAVSRLTSPALKMLCNMVPHIMKIKEKKRNNKKHPHSFGIEGLQSKCKLVRLIFFVYLKCLENLYEL